MDFPLPRPPGVTASPFRPSALLQYRPLDRVARGGRRCVGPRRQSGDWSLPCDSLATSGRRAAPSIPAQKCLSTLWTSVWTTVGSLRRPVDRTQHGARGPECTLHSPTRSPTGCSQPTPLVTNRARSEGRRWTSVDMWIASPGSPQRLAVATCLALHNVESDVENWAGCARSSTNHPLVPVVHAVHRPTTSPTLLKETPEIQRRVDGAGTDRRGLIQVVHPARPRL